VIHDQTNVILNIIVKETQRKLCTLKLPQHSTLDEVRAKILEKNLNVVKKNLFITEQQCLPRIIMITFNDREFMGAKIYKLAHMGMTNGNEYYLTVQFVRALAILSVEEVKDLMKEVRKKTQGKYPDELIK